MNKLCMQKNIKNQIKTLAHALNSLHDEKAGLLKEVRVIRRKIKLIELHIEDLNSMLHRMTKK